MISKRLVKYVKDGLKKYSEKEIKKTLVKEGYPKELVENVVKAAVEVNKKDEDSKKNEENIIKKLEEKKKLREAKLKEKKQQNKENINKLKERIFKNIKNNSKLLILVLIMIIIGTSFFVFNNWFCNIKNKNSLVLDLNFDNYSIKGNSTVIKDNSEYGNDGMLKGDAKLVDTDFGKAVELNGSGYVEVKDDNSLDISDEITIMAWIYHKGNKTQQIIVGNGGGWGDNGYHIMLRDNKVRFELQDTGRGEKTICDSTLINDNEWYCVVATWNAADNIMHIYINNIETNTETFIGPIGDSNASLGIGYGLYPTYNGSYFNGSIHQVKIYDMSLSQAEIFYLYNQSRK